MKNNKGFTLIELSISIVVVVLFSTIVANISYSIFINSMESKITAKATEHAVEVLEYVGTMDIEESFDEQTGKLNNSVLPIVRNKYSNASLDTNNNKINFTMDDGKYNVEIKFEDYADLPENRGKSVEVNILKIVTVKINYNVGQNEENISMKRIITKNTTN